MDTTIALDRHLDEADSTYASYPESDNEIVDTLSDEQRHLIYEIRGVQKIMAIDDKYDLVTPAEWHERLAECRTRLRALLEEEQNTIQGTIDLHCAGLIRCNTRFLEIASVLKQMEVAI